MNVESIVAILTLVCFGGLTLALFWSERLRRKMETQADKETQEIKHNQFTAAQTQFNEELNDLDKKRQEYLHDLDTLKHAKWGGFNRSRHEWRPGDDFPRSL